MMLSERCWPVAIRVSEVLPAYARHWRRRLALSNVCFVRDFDTKTVGVGPAHLKMITGLWRSVNSDLFRVRMLLNGAVSGRSDVLGR